MSTSRALLDFKLSRLAEVFPTASGHTLTLLPPIQWNYWFLAERNDETGELLTIIRLGREKVNASHTLDAMIYCFSR